MHTAQFHLDPDGAWTTTSDASIPPGQHLALAFWSDIDDQTVESHAAALAALLPDALVLGCSTSGVIQDRAIRDATMCATLIVFEHTRLSLVRGSLSAFPDSRDLGAFLASQIDPTDLAHVLVLAPGLAGNGSRLAKSLAESLPAGVLASGALAGDGERFARTTLLLGRKILENEVLCVGLHGRRLRVSMGIGGGWEPFGMERIITASEANQLMRIDGESALGLYESYLGKHAQNLPGSGHLFPLALRESPTSGWVTRTILGLDRERQTLFFGGDMPKGGTVRFSRGTITNLVDGATEAAAMIPKSTGPSFALLVSCVGRRMLLKQFAEEEIDTVADILGPDTTLAGMYSYGEIAPGDDVTCCLHNQTMILTVLAERD